MKSFVLQIIFVLAFNNICYCQSKIVNISAQGFYNQKGILTNNIIGKETGELPYNDAPINQTLITVEIYKTPELGGPTRQLRLTAFSENKQIYSQSLNIAFGGFNYKALYLLNQDPVGVRVKIELLESGKIVSTKEIKQLVRWSGD